MIPTTTTWQSKRTEESLKVEELLRKRFEQVDSYRYNSASIRVRVIDSKFEGLNRDDRVTMVEYEIDKLPREIQRDIVTLLTFAPSDLVVENGNYRDLSLNAEFEEPSPSEL